MQSKYQRRRDPSEKKSSSAEEGGNSTGNTDKNLYKDIEKSKEEQEKAKLMSMQEQVRAATNGINNAPFRNIDPFEKKKRLAQQQDFGGELSSRKVTSRREEAEARRD